MRGPRATHTDTTSRELNRVAAHHAYAHGQARARHKPIEVFLQVASGCNLDCYMCSEHNRPVETRHGRDLTSLSRDLYDKIAAEIFPLSSMVYIGVGGEPMLSPHFTYYVERAWELGQRVRVMTNGTRIDRPEMAELFARCVAYVQISIDGATKATYERIRLGATFARMQKNLSLLNEARSRYPKAERTRVCLCFVLMKSNVDELPAFVEMAARFAAEEVHAHHVIPVTEEGKGETLVDEPERWNAIRAIALARAAELGVELDVPKEFPVGDAQDAGAASAVGTVVATWLTSSAMPTPSIVSTPPLPSPRSTLPTPSRLSTPSTPSTNSTVFTQSTQSTQSTPSTNDNAVSPSRALASPESGSAELELLARGMAPRSAPIACRMPTLETFIFYDGRVFPCCHPYAHEKMQVGDLRTQSFESIWNGPLYQNLRAGLRTGDVPSICQLCSIVHDPPPGREDPETIRKGQDLATLYAGRDVAGADEGANGESDLLVNLGQTGIVEHVEALVRERDGLLGHATTIQRERDALLGHVDAIQRERDALRGHTQTIEREHDALLGHVENLERIISKTRALWTYRVLGGIRRLFFPKKHA